MAPSLFDERFIKSIYPTLLTHANKALKPKWACVFKVGSAYSTSSFLLLLTALPDSLILRSNCVPHHLAFRGHLPCPIGLIAVTLEFLSVELETTFIDIAYQT